jgi:2',3'-cyclic-nucleotide 2'-phosphodiesterase (5'-nucleotidase family)
VVNVLRSLRAVAASALILGSGAAWCSPETEAFAPAQAAADVLREAAGAEIAFLPAGMLKSAFEPENLASLLQYPTDELAVVNLRGSQIRLAFERSVSLFPSPSSAFLQLSGIEFTFSRSAAPDSRVLTITLDGQRLDPNRTYSVAMPATIARGGLGYFRVWNRDQIARVMTGVTLESLLRGRPVKASPARVRAEA